MKTQQRTRANFIVLLYCCVYILLLINVYLIAIGQRSFFADLAHKQYHITITQPPERALIVDRNGKPLALNTQSTAAFIMPHNLKQKDPVLNFLQQHFPRAHQRLLDQPNARFLYIKRKLLESEKQLISQSGLCDIKFLQEPTRFYPMSCAAHIVGNTDIDNNALFGIERIANKQLAGTPSKYALEKDARSGYCYFAKITQQWGAEGTQVCLTIDGDLQFLVTEQIKKTVEHFNAQEGAALVINPHSGEILAMAQWPICDPHALCSDQLSLTKNKCVTESYELGSVMKIFAAMAALEEGVVQTDEPIDCENTKTTYLNGIKVNTVTAHGVLAFSQVIELSNNIGIAKVIQRLGPRLYDHYKRLGFGKKTDLQWPGEQKGFINNPPNWSKQSAISLSFGYEITATLLQLACALCIIANGGFAIQPHLIRNENYSVTHKNPLYSGETIATMHDILEKTVLKGTAQKAALRGCSVKGKTGTANLLVNGAYNPDYNTYTFAGIIEKNKCENHRPYQRVIVTFIKQAQQKNLYASTVAAPLFERIAEYVLIHDKMV